MQTQQLSTLRSLHLDSASKFALRSEAGKLSTNLSTITIRQDFTSNMINTLEDGAANLTNADMNEEGANMLMLQTRQQLGTTSLSLASQAAQSVLRLF
jgi:flagellin